MNRSIFMVVSAALLAVGLFIIFNSVSWGSSAADAYLRSHGGGMDTGKFMIFVEGYINAYRWTGSILAVIGGFGLIKAVELRSSI